MSPAATEPSISFRISRVMDRAGLTGQRQHDMRLGKQPAYVDSARSVDNTLLALAPGYDGRASRWSRFLDREDEALAVRRLQNGKNRNMWRSAILTFSREAAAQLKQPPEDEAKAAFGDFASRHGVRLLWAVGHHDETTVHYHAMFENIMENGKALRLSRADLSHEQDIAASHFSHLGLVRGKPKRQRIADQEPTSNWVNRNVKQLHDDLPREIELAREQLATAEKRAAKAEAKAKQYEADAELSLRRLRKYERQIEALEDRLAQLEAVAAKVPQLAADDLLPAVLEKRFLGDLVEEPEQRAERINKTLREAAAPLVAAAQRGLLAQGRLAAAEARVSASEAAERAYHDLTHDLTPHQITELAAVANGKRVEAEQQRRVDALPGLLARGVGAVLVFARRALEAIKSVGNWRGVDWESVQGQTMREACEYDHPRHETAEVVLRHSPHHADKTEQQIQAVVARIKEKYAPALAPKQPALDDCNAAESAQRPSTPPPPRRDDDYEGPGL